MPEIVQDTSENQTVPIEIKDNSKRAKNLLIVFWILVGFNFIGLISGYLEYDLLLRIGAGDLYTDEEITNSDLRQSILGISQTVISILSVVFFIYWFRRAYANLHRSGLTYLKYEESMALWAWFIPILNWFRPVKIMNEIWTETQEKIKKFDSGFVLSSGTSR